MKKLYMTLLCIVVLLVGCSMKPTPTNAGGNQQTSVLNTTMTEMQIPPSATSQNASENLNENQPVKIFDLTSCAVFVADENYRVDIYPHGNFFGGSTVFSDDGILLSAEGFSPIQEDDIESLYQLSEAELIKQYGKFHFDGGSGVSFSGYVTNTGQIIYFSQLGTDWPGMGVFHIISGERQQFGSLDIKYVTQD